MCPKPGQSADLYLTNQALNPGLYYLRFDLPQEMGMAGHTDRGEPYR
jgi:hypothetical protein